MFAREPGAPAGRRPRADVPGRAAGPGADRLPHAPARDRPRRRPARGAGRGAGARLGRSEPTDELEPPSGGHACGSATTTATSRAGSRSRPGDRRRRAARQARALPAARHGGARGADAAGRARHDRGRHLAPQRPRLRPHGRGGEGARGRRRGRRGVLHGAHARSSGSATVAAAGENMPPKSTYFFPKVLTGMVFNPLEDEMALINRSAHAVTGKMRAIARRREGFTHDLKVGGHQLTADEPRGAGRPGHGPEPAGAARRLARLVHGGDDGDVRRAQGLGRQRPRGRLPLHAGRARLSRPASSS